MRGAELEDLPWLVSWSDVGLQAMLGNDGTPGGTPGDSGILFPLFRSM